MSTFRKPSAAGSFGFGTIIGIPAFLVAGKVFCWALPAAAAALDYLL